jgi:hypothetical protein
MQRKAIYFPSIAETKYLRLVLEISLDAAVLKALNILKARPAFPP